MERKTTLEGRRESEKKEEDHVSGHLTYIWPRNLHLARHVDHVDIEGIKQEVAGWEAKTGGKRKERWLMFIVGFFFTSFFVTSPPLRLRNFGARNTGN